MVTRVCVNIGSGNDSSPVQRSAITWTNVDILTVGSLGPNIVKFELNSLVPSDAISRQRSGSTLAQEMACCLTTPSHYLNQCCLIISKVEWRSYKGKFARDTSINEIIWKIKYLKFHSNVPGGNELSTIETLHNTLKLELNGWHSADDTEMYFIERKF